MDMNVYMYKYDCKQWFGDMEGIRNLQIEQKSDKELNKTNIAEQAI